MDEESMRDDPLKHQRFDELAAGRYLRPVVAAQRAYLRAAVAEPQAGERDHWTMSCLPPTTPV
ncbi:hypothetical protein [Actinoplanes sp. URMC 104]|uniref:hypothetical protein n=1 Tax=Actinoplanes sp. URMC 104 TaxID=3423409 RepID=UPI003F1C824A